MESQLGVYGQAFIKKHSQYWPKGVPGDMIDGHFKDQDIGKCETLQVEFEGKKMYIHCQKEEKYVTKFMSMFGTLDNGNKTKQTTQSCGIINRNTGLMITTNVVTLQMTFLIPGRRSGGVIISFAFFLESLR